MDGTVFIKIGNGRLGNQLFKILGANQLAVKYNKEFKIIYDYNPKIYTETPVYPILLEKVKFFFGKCLVNEVPSNYNYTLLSKDDNRDFHLLDDQFLDNIFKNKYVLIDNYLQNEYYIDTSFAKKFLSIRPKEYNYIRDKYGSLTDTIAISIRRGDYLKKKYLKLFLSPTKDWYQDVYTNFFEGKDVLISSDDIQWCKDNLKFPDNVKVQYINESSAEIALYALSQCKGWFIGSNSTFSWWAAWIGEDMHKIIFPDKWWTKPNILKNMLPDRWITYPVGDRYEQ